MTWVQYLDTFEDQMDSVEQSLQSNCEFDPNAIGVFNPPQELGQLPSQLASRATALLERNKKLQTALQVALTNVADQLADVKRESSAVRGYDVSSGAVPQYFDNNA